MMSPPFPVGIRLFLDMSEKDPKSVNSLSQFRYRFAIRVKRKYSYKWHMSCWIVRDLFAFLTDNSLPAVSLPVDMPVFVSKTDDSEAATEREYWINERYEIFRIEDPRGKNTHRRWKIAAFSHHFRNFFFVSPLSIRRNFPSWGYKNVENT